MEMTREPWKNVFPPERRDDVIIGPLKIGSLKQILEQTDSDVLSCRKQVSETRCERLLGTPLCAIRDVPPLLLGQLVRRKILLFLKENC